MDAIGGAGIKNGIYRGKDLGPEVTAEQKSAIADGNFKGLFLGDYWHNSTESYIITDFDYWYHVNNDTVPQTHNAHHVVIWPMWAPQSVVFNTNADIATVGHVGSNMYSTRGGVATTMEYFEGANGLSGISVLEHPTVLISSCGGNGPTSYTYRNVKAELPWMVYLFGHEFRNIISHGRKQFSLWQLLGDSRLDNYIGIFSPSESLWLNDIETNTKGLILSKTGKIGRVDFNTSQSIKVVFAMGGY